jgi:hypothetical protein
MWSLQPHWRPRDRLVLGAATPPLLACSDKSDAFGDPSATVEPTNESPPSMVGRGYRWLGEGYRFVTGPSVVNFKRPSDRAPHSSVGPLPCHQDVAEIFPQRAAPVPVKPGWRRRRLSHAWRPGYLAIARVAARGVPGGPVMRPVSGLFPVWTSYMCAADSDPWPLCIHPRLGPALLRAWRPTCCPDTSTVPRNS